MIAMRTDIGQQRERLVCVGMIAVMMLLVLLLILGIAVLWRIDAQLSLGNIAEIPVGGVAYYPVAQPIQVTFFGIQQRARARPVVGPVYLVRPSPTHVLVFAQRDPRNGCLVTWQPSDKYFIDPCHGSTYAYTGEHVRGPARRGLNQVAVHVRTNGEILIRRTVLIPGPSAQ